MDLSEGNVSSSAGVTATSATSTLAASTSSESNMLSVGSMDESSFAKTVYACKKCKFTTTWKSSLLIHQRTHTNERPFQCPLCGKHFKLKHHLKHHILTHSAVKPISCNMCGYRTADQRNMQQHKFRMHRLPMKRSTRGRHLMKLPTMVPGSHIDYDQVSQFVDQGISLSQTLPVAAAAPPLSTPNFQSAMSPVFQTPAGSFEAAPSGRMPWSQLNQTSASASLTSFVDRSLLDGGINASGGEKGDDIFLKSPDHMPSSSPESLPTTVKDESELPSTLANSAIHNVVGSPPNSAAATGWRRSSQDSYRTTDSAVPVVVRVHSESDAPDRSNGEKWKCKHCEIVFPDNIMYGLHMGCHSVSSPYQCNVCGATCRDRHDFMFHFTIGKHQ